MANEVCYHCEYARMWWETRGATLTPENCDLHKDGFCPDLDGEVADGTED